MKEEAGSDDQPLTPSGDQHAGRPILEMYQESGIKAADRQVPSKGQGA